MTILTWDLILISMMMGMATLLILVSLVGIRTHRAGKDRPPEGTFLGLMILATMAAMITFLVLVAELKAIMVS